MTMRTCDFRSQQSSSPYPINLISYQESKGFSLTQQGRCFLESLSDKPLAIVTIAGMYRTGKSFLVNQMLHRYYECVGGSVNSFQSRQNKFLVGNTINSVTKGLNVWSQPISSRYCRSDGQNSCIKKSLFGRQSSQNKKASEDQFFYLLIDSEGIGSMEQNKNYDMNLLLLIFLISSKVIYNSVGAIDEDSLEQLRVLTNLSKSVFTSQTALKEINTNTKYRERNTSIKKQQLCDFTQPKLTWVLRDFTLQLIDKNGREMTSNQYLEDCLQQTKLSHNQMGNSSHKKALKQIQIQKKNQIRQAIKQNLPNRECITLIRPTLDENQLNNLQSLPVSGLREEFVEELDKLYDQIFTNSPHEDIKVIQGMKANNLQQQEEGNQILLNGERFIQIIEYFLQEINLNKVPEVKTIWEMMSQTHLEEKIEELNDTLKRQTMKVDLPYKDEVKLREKVNAISDRVWEGFERQISSIVSINKQRQIFEEFRANSRSTLEKILRVNYDIRCKKSLKQVRDHIKENILFESIDPCNIVEFSEVLEGLFINENKAKGQSASKRSKQSSFAYEIQTPSYEYILHTLKDYLYISQQKSLKMRQQLQEQRTLNIQNQHNSKQKDQQLLKLKSEYSQTLKQIQTLKHQKIQREELISTFSQQQQVLRQNYHQISLQSKRNQDQHQKQLESINQKTKKRNEDSLTSLKQMRVKNEELQKEIEGLKEQINEKERSERKEIIFEEKLQESWDKFQEERKYLKEELSKYKELYSKTEEHLSKLRVEHEKACQSLVYERESHLKKEREFCEQLKWMKENYAKTKHTYQKTQLTKQENNKILKGVGLLDDSENNFERAPLRDRSNTKLQSSSKGMMRNNVINENENCQKCSQFSNGQSPTYKAEVKVLQEEIKSLKLTMKSKDKTIESLKSVNYEEKEVLKGKMKALEKQKMEEKLRFSNALRELELCKEKERNLYEESISRLLVNISKKNKS